MPWGVCGDLVPWSVRRRPGAMGCVEETWCHGVCGGDLVPWGVWRRPGAMGCVEETGCDGVCGGTMGCGEETWGGDGVPVRRGRGWCTSEEREGEEMVYQ